jgi:hypothetical protein
MSPKSEAKDPRRERLARALRENLKRRKAQIRGRAENAVGTGEQVLVEQAPGKQAAGERDFEDQVSGKVSGQKV